MEMITVTAKTVEDAITQASLQLGVSSDRIQYEVVEKGSAGVLGGLFGSKPAVIRAKKIETVDDKAVDFLNSVFDAMGLAVDVEVKMNEEEKEMDVNLSGEEMGLLIGKRGQTLDSLQYQAGYRKLQREKKRNTGNSREEYRLQGKTDKTSGFLRADESV